MSEDYSIQTGTIRSLSTLDYVLFSILFVVSTLIGFYHAFRWRKETSEFEFHFAGQKLHPVPVSMSLSATFFSAITILGVPAEVYTHNTMFLWSIAAAFLSTIFVAHVFVPFFYNLKLKSCYRYLELRYSRLIRLLTSSLFLVQYMLYASIALYLPSLALEAIIGVSLWYIMIVVCFVCALYTILGGMRSVVWVDSLQLFVIVGGLVAALIGGSNASGGVQHAWRTALEGHRIKFDELSVDPRTRHSVWSVTIGFSLLLMYNYGMAQVQVQRVCTLSSSRKATIASWLSFPIFALIQVLVCLTGIVMYAFYSRCDPVKFKLINKNDQLLPLFVLDVLGKIPGMPGVFLACIFSGSLSSISSCLSTVSTVLLEDFVRPNCFRKYAERKGLLVSRVLVFVLACCQFLFAVVVSKMSRLVLQFTNSVYAVISGPIMGLFMSGMFLPWTNTKGALVGLFVSLAVMLWLCISTLVERPLWTKPLSVNTTGCNWNVTLSMAYGTNYTSSLSNTTVTVAPKAEPVLYDFYRISYLWYTGLGMIINIFTTLLTSFITGYNKPTSVDSRLLCPIFDKLFPWLPENIRRPLRCGVQYSPENVVDDSTRRDKSEEAQNQTTRLIEVL